MKKSVILLTILVLVLCGSGCSMSENQETAAAESNPQIVLPEATPYIIYVTATAEPQAEQMNSDTSVSTDLLSGKVVYSKFLSQDPVNIQIFMMNLADGVEQQITSNGVNSQPMWSPDGTKIMYTSMSDETSYDIAIMDADGGNAYSLVATKGMDGNAVWSPDGKTVIYNSDVDGNTEIYSINVETKEVKQLTNDDSGYHGAPSWSPDGKKMVFVYGDGVQYGTHLYVYDLETGVSQEIDGDKFYQDDLPVWTADGQHIIFQRANGDFPRIINYDLNQLEESYLTEDLFPDVNAENRAERAVHGNYVSFSVNGKFYVMDIDQRLVYPLGVDALDLHYYPQ